MQEAIQITEESVELPLATEDGGVLTSRAFVTGTSGSGKSNTVGVICEHLLDEGFPMMIVDTEGEYFGLKEQYRILHAGVTEECDLKIGVEHSEKLAELALEENVPIILDVSGFIDEEEANQVIEETLKHLFQKEQKLKKPFPVILEEAHNYIPQKSKPDVADIVLKIGKQGRKRGLGLIAVSQRPASVDKDFITQSDWRIWHRFEWGNDLDVAYDVLGNKKITEDELEKYEDRFPDKDLEAGDKVGFDEIIAQFEPGQGILECGFIDKDKIEVKFKRKNTFDAGATPTLEDYERPELKDIDESVLGELQEVSEEKRKRQDRIERLQQKVEEKDETIEGLEDELEKARNVSELGEQLVSAIREGGGDEAVAEKIDEIRDKKNNQIKELEQELEEKEEELENAREKASELEQRVAELEEYEEYAEIAEELEQKKEMVEEALQRIGEAFDLEMDGKTEEASKQLKQKQERIKELERKIERVEEEGVSAEEDRFKDSAEFLENNTVRDQVEKASEKTTYDVTHFWDILTVIAQERGASVKEIVPLVEISKSSVQSALSKLKEEKVLYAEKDGQTPIYYLNTEGISDIIALREKRERIKDRSEKLKKEV